MPSNSTGSETIGAGSGTGGRASGCGIAGTLACTSSGRAVEHAESACNIATEARRIVVFCQARIYSFALPSCVRSDHGKVTLDLSTPSLSTSPLVESGLHSLAGGVFGSKGRTTRRGVSTEAGILGNHVLIVTPGQSNYTGYRERQQPQSDRFPVSRKQLDQQANRDHCRGPPVCLEEACPADRERDRAGHGAQTGERCDRPTRRRRRTSPPSTRS